MQYELAKKLKDAGFPNADKRCSYCIEIDQPKCNVCEDRTIGLSELIEACGDKFDALGKCKDDGVSRIVDGWIAVDEDNKRRWGKTPEEAVAKLWLALNKK